MEAKYKKKLKDHDFIGKLKMTHLLKMEKEKRKSLLFCERTLLLKMDTGRAKVFMVFTL